MRTQIKAILLLLLFVSGCTPAAYLIRENRVKYELNQQDDLMTSTADVRPQQKQVPARTQDGIRISATILVQNTSKDQTYELLLSKSKLTLNEIILPTSCTSKTSTEGSDKLSAGAKAQILCEASLTLKDIPTLSVRDDFAKFLIPYASTTGRKGNINILYKLKLEDFHQ